MRTGKIFASLAGLILVAIAGNRLHAQDLTDATYSKWHNYVLPKPDELAYQRIPWRTSFWEAIVEAQDKNRPVLLWSMNGHPLCNT